MKNEQRRERWLKIAEGLLSCPTAPLLEDCPAAFVREFAAARPSITPSIDRCGNILLKHKHSGGSAAKPIVLVAHLDHPGFHVTGIKGNRINLSFQGGVRMPHAIKGSGICFYRRGETKRIGKGRLTATKARQGWLESATAQLISGQADSDGYAMWDFPPFRIRGGQIVSRCCDDLLGAAAALGLLDELARGRTPPRTPVWALFTRSEEIGFYGALTAAQDGLIPKNAYVISLECSRALKDAPKGAGVIVRVGDRTSIFDPFFTECLTRACMSLRKKDPGFRFLRKLMDGGTCEATVFCAKGYPSSGLALPLGNYHNMAGLDGGPKRMGPESVRVDDFEAEIRLLLELAKNGSRLDKLADAVPKGLALRARKAERAFRKFKLKK